MKWSTVLKIGGGVAGTAGAITAAAILANKGGNAIESLFGGIGDILFGGNNVWLSLSSLLSLLIVGVAAAFIFMQKR